VLSQAEAKGITCFTWLPLEVAISIINFAFKSLLKRNLKTQKKLPSMPNTNSLKIFVLRRSSFLKLFLTSRSFIHPSDWGTSNCVNWVTSNKQTLPIIFTKMANKMQLCRIIYYSLAALHVSSYIFAHHQEHLNCIYSFWFYSRMSLSAAVMAE